MKLQLKLLLVLPLVFSGCAHYKTVQTDKSAKDKNGIETRTIITTVKASTFFDSQSKLAAFKASQTDKTQSTSVGSLDQGSSSTNLNALVSSVVEGAVIGASKFIKP